MRPVCSSLILLLSTVALGQSRNTGLNGGAWQIIAPHILVAFQQPTATSCTWRFKNSDDFHTLQSMKFSYSYSSGPLTRPTSITGPQTSTDVLTMPLAPQEDTGDQANYLAPASCITVRIRVLDAKWL